MKPDQERLSEQARAEMVNDIYAWLRSQFRDEGLGMVTRRYFSWLLAEVNSLARQLTEAERENEKLRSDLALTERARVFTAGQRDAALAQLITGESAPESGSGEEAGGE